MRLLVISAHLPRAQLPRLEDIGAAMMTVPNPCGYTFKSFVPLLVDEVETDAQTHH